MHSIRIAKGFEMRVLAHDMIENESAARELDFTYLSLQEVLSRSDIITLHVNLNKTTHHLLSATSLPKMKRGALLVNTSRGAVVDTSALMAALRSGHLGGAGLDVLEDERETYHDFTGLNVVITPHLGWYTREAADRILDIALGNIAGFMRGEIINRVTPTK
jgi:lactate dehydrogenase-like 2-hydroxyacid dehydrogenase